MGYLSFKLLEYVIFSRFMPGHGLQLFFRCFSWKTTTIMKNLNNLCKWTLLLCSVPFLVMLTSRWSTYYITTVQAALFFSLKIQIKRIDPSLRTVPSTSLSTQHIWACYHYSLNLPGLLYRIQPCWATGVPKSWWLSVCKVYHSITWMSWIR